MDYRDITLETSASLQDVGSTNQNFGLGAVFIVNEIGELNGIISDGDFRKAILSGASLDELAINYMNKSPFTLPDSTSLADLAENIIKYKIIPIINKDGVLVNFYSNLHTSEVPISQPALKGNEIKYVMECLETNWISSQGKFVNRFESELSKYVNAKATVAVSNGTVAIQLALSVLGVSDGDEVIIPSLTFGATANAVMAVGAKPCFVDVCRDTLNLDINKTLAAINPNTKAIIAVDLYGVPFQMEHLREKLSHRKDILLIQDCAESLGAYNNGKHTGSYADACTFSFFANKIITAGEGGAVCFFKDGYIDKAKVMRDHGMDPNNRYFHLLPGFNYRMTNIQAAIACGQLEKIDHIIDERRKIYNIYDNEFKALDLKFQSITANNSSSPWLYTFRAIGQDIQRIQGLMKINGIDTRRIFQPLPDMPPFKKYMNHGTEVAYEAYRYGISLPTFYGMTSEQALQVSKNLNSAIIKDESLGIKA
tara:strand:- start:319 stop:1764 length:1446 start_codon:yes stop_codon:yes gene_type:complete